MTNVIESNAFNLSEFISSGVDARTLSFSLQFPIGEIVCNLSNEQIVSPIISFNSGNITDSGFGVGWGVSLCRYDKAAEKLYLENGQSFYVEYERSTGEYRFPYRKTNDIKFTDTEDGYQLVQKDGQSADFNSDGLLVKQTDASGRHLHYTYVKFMNNDVVETIRDDGNISIVFDYDETQTTVRYYVDDLTVRSVRFDKFSSNNGYLLKHLYLPDDEENHFVIDYEFDAPSGYHFISEIVYPGGRIERIYYADNELLLPPKAPIEYMPSVRRFVIEHGCDQPNTDTYYRAMTSHNYLGYGGSRDWEAGIDTLFFCPSDYVYETEEVTENKKIVRRFNKYHCEIVTSKYDDDALYEQQITDYLADEKQYIDEQPINYTLPHTITTTFYYDGHSRQENVELTYDSSGNLIEKLTPDGTRQIQRYAPPEGIPGVCPPEDNGMIRFIVEQTIEPASHDDGEPTRSVRYFYASFLSQDQQQSVILPITEIADERLTKHYQYYTDASDALSYLKRKTERVQGKTNTTTIHYDYAFENGIKTTVTTTGFDGANQTTSSTQDLVSQEIIQLDDPDGVRSRFAYDALNRVVSEVVGEETQYQAAKTYSHVMSPDNNAVTITDSQNNIEIQYTDNSGRLREVKRREGSSGTLYTVASYQYNALGLVVSETHTDWLDGTALALTTTFEYDAWDNVRVTYHPDGRTEYTLNDPTTGAIASAPAGVSARQVQTIEGLGSLEVWKTLFGEDRVIRSIDNQGSLYATETITYDTLGRKLTQQDAENNITAFSYDSFNRITRKTDATGVVHQVSYADFPTQTLAEHVYADDYLLGSKHYDGIGRLITEYQSSAVLHYTYENGGTLPVSVSLPEGTQRMQSVNTALKAITQMRFSDATPDVDFDYDPASGLVIQTSHDGLRVDSTYSPGGHLIEQRRDYNGTSRTAYQNVSLMGKLLEATDYFGHSEFWRYDDVGRLSSVTEDIGGHTIDFAVTYDSYSRPITMTWSFSQNTAQSVSLNIYYNERGLERERIYLFGGVSQLSIETDYDSRNLIHCRKVFRQGVASLTEYFTYDALKRLKEYQCHGVHLPEDAYGNKIVSKVLTYDRLNNIDTIVLTFDDDSTNRSEYVYLPDDLIRLSHITHSHGSYPSEQSVIFDAGGNVIQDEQGRRYTYNGQSQLTQVENDDHLLVSAYRYDGEGNQAIQQVPEQADIEFFYVDGTLKNEHSDGYHTHYTTIFERRWCRTLISDAAIEHQMMLLDSQGNVLSTLTISDAQSQEQQFIYTPSGKQHQIS